MGFFLLENRRRSRGKKPISQKVRFGPKTERAMNTLHNLSCKACPLNNAPVNTPKMKPGGSKKPIVYFLAEAPGKTEDEKGEPLIGKSGQLIRNLIPYDFEDHVAFDNVIRDRPKDNRNPTWVEIECCRPNIIASIEKAKPKIIIGLGKFALDWATNLKDMPAYRGRFFSIKVGKHTCWFMPTYHPAFILRGPDGKAVKESYALRSKFGHCLKMDLKRVFDVVEDLPLAQVDSIEEAKKNIICIDGSNKSDLESLKHYLNLATKAGRAGVDLETSCLRPYKSNADILTCAIAWKRKGEIQTVAFALNHKEAGWSEEQGSKVWDLFKKFLYNKKVIKVAQNVPFELEWCCEFLGEKVAKASKWDDTMVSACLLDGRTGKKVKGEERTVAQSLDFLTFQNFGIRVKSLSKVNIKDMANERLVKILPYNGIDAKYCLKLDYAQRKLLDGKGLTDTYNDHMRRQSTVSLMQHFGLPVDQKIIKKAQKDLGGELTKIQKKIDNLKVVKKFKKEQGKFNSASNPDVIAIFRDYLKRPEIKVTKKYAKNEDDFSYKADEGVLKQINHPLAKLLLRKRGRAKLKSTYIDPFEFGVGNEIYPDGYLHYVFNTTFAVSSRLSSDSPNMQNFPIRKDKWIRAAIIPPPKHILIAADYGQIEARTAAMTSEDKYLAKALVEGYDIHMEWAEKLVHLYPDIIGGKKFLKDKKVMSSLRQRMKNKYVFPAIFGATVPSLAGYLNVPIDIIEDLTEDFFDTFSGVYDWQKELVKDYYETGYVETLGGRRRYYPMTRNEAISHPVQGSAAEITCDAMCNLSDYAIKNDLYYYHPRLNIHDDLTFAVPDKDSVIEDTLDKIIKTMLTPSYSWVSVPIEVDISIGKNWQDMEKFGKFASNKDL